MIDEVDEAEAERLRRKKFVICMREREARTPRYCVNEDELREKRMQDRDRQGEQIDRAAESARVWNWLEQQKQLDGQRSEPVRVAAGVELTETFDWQWVDRRIAAALREQRNYFEQELASMNSALIEHTKATNAAMDAIVNMVDSVFSKAAKKTNNQLIDVLQRITELMNSNQHQIMRAINNRIGDSKPVDEAQSTRRGVH
jgi:hypothetical protein